MMQDPDTEVTVTLRHHEWKTISNALGYAAVQTNMKDVRRRWTLLRNKLDIAVPDEYSPDVEDYQEQIDRMDQTIEDLQSDLERADQTIKELHQRLMLWTDLSRCCRGL